MTKGLTPLAIACLCLCACSDSNNLLLGEVRATLGTHKILVTDCYRTSPPLPRQTGPAAYEYAPCRDAVVALNDEKLTVNGQSYGRLHPNDSILVDHGKVSVRAN